MRRLLLVLVLICTTSSLCFSAKPSRMERRTNKKFFIEIGGANMLIIPPVPSYEANLFASKNDRYGRIVLFAPYAELRWNFSSVPISIGLHGGLLVSAYHGYEYDFGFYTAGQALAIGEYWFRKGETVSFFAGLGVGYTEYEYPVRYINDIGCEDEDKTYAISFICTPRVGMRFANRVTVGFDYKISKKPISGIAMRVGVFF